MRATLLVRLLLGVSGLAPHARAQRDNGTSVYLTPIATTVGTQTEWPGAIAVDSTGTAFVAYSGSTSGIRKIIPDRGATAFAGAVFGNIACIAVDANDHVYAVDGAVIRRFAPDGTAMRLAVGGFVDDKDRTTPSVALPRVQGIAVDIRGNIYLASSYHMILKATPDGGLTTFAGATGEFGSADGIASARFKFPTALTVDRGGNVFVADSGNHSIRKITPDGNVSTFAGLAGTYGVEDGTGTAARFRAPYGIAMDRFGTLYVMDVDGYDTAPSVGERIRRITPGGVVTTLSLLGDFLGFDGGFAADPNGTLYGTDSWLAAVFMGAFRPAFAVRPVDQLVAPGSVTAFSATVTSAIPVTYQWQKDGDAIPGATASTLPVDNVQIADLGAYTLVATNKAGSTASYPATLRFAGSSASALLNLSIRSHVGPGAETAIVGFTLAATGTGGAKPLLIRSVGPTLDSFGVAGFLADPVLAVFSGQRLVAANDDWNGDTTATTVGRQVGAFAFAASTSRDAALYFPGLVPGSYVMQVSSGGGSSGVALAEVYDATPAGGFNASTPRLINVSARALVGHGEETLFIANFTIGGAAAKTLLIRAVGPSLGAFGVTGALADPKLELFQGATLLQSNDNWGGVTALASAADKVGAFAIDGASRDAALLVTLPPGSYTARVSGVADTTVVALVEVYEAP